MKQFILIFIAVTILLLFYTSSGQIPIWTLILLLFSLFAGIFLELEGRINYSTEVIIQAIGGIIAIAIVFPIALTTLNQVQFGIQLAQQNQTNQTTIQSHP